MDSYSKSYEEAGVNVTESYRSTELIKIQAERTKIKGVLSGIGGFGGLFKPDLKGMESPVFVSGTDGVGTKLKIAFLMNKHDTIGIDCVAMCANDIVCSGAMPLYFLDYLAVGKLKPERVEEIVKGVANGCIEAGCALIGGETAEMPGFYPADEYDIAGFCVGIVEESKVINCNLVKEGDALIGVASSGVHSNGFSLIRKVFNVTEERLKFYVNDFGKTLGEELLTPTKIYVKPLSELLSAVKVHGISHITGGGFYENIPRMLPEGLCAVVEKNKIPQKPIFNLIKKEGISERDMYNTFNMGLGLCIAVENDQADEAVRILRKNGEEAMVVGQVKLGEKGVTIC